ncbi:MAG: hypothetical protein OXG15_03490 [Gammaproteobacteria bacterium]|nr:hypothetical protein [Gammaproteobacteria bacterium]
MDQLTWLSLLAAVSIALMTTHVTFAGDATDRWKKRMPGSLVVSTYAPTDELRRHCPDFMSPLKERGIRGGFTPDCESRLDEHFANEVPRQMPFEAKDARITWRYVFDQPQVKRKIVLDAITNPECQEFPNEPSADHIAEECRVDVIADYATLKYNCTSGFYNSRGLLNNGIEFPWWYAFSIMRLFDNESYWRTRWRIENVYFRSAWISAKCAGLPDDALASLGVFENTSEFGGKPAPGEEDWWWAEQSFEAYQLMGIADQLSANFNRIDYGYDFDSIRSWQLVQPVVAELLQIKDLGRDPRSSELKTARLKHYIAAQTWIKKRRKDVSEDWLIRQVGEFSDEELAQAVDEATKMMHQQEVGTKWN